MFSCSNRTKVSWFQNDLLQAYTLQLHAALWRLKRAKNKLLGQPFFISQYTGCVRPMCRFSVLKNRHIGLTHPVPRVSTRAIRYIRLNIFLKLILRKFVNWKWLMNNKYSCFEHNNLWKSQIFKSTIGQLTILPKIWQIMSNHWFHFNLGKIIQLHVMKKALCWIFFFTLLNVWKKVNNCIKF